MFSPQQKHEIAMQVQALLQSTAHEELPAGEINFILHVDGVDEWSWANIRNGSAREMPVPRVLVQNMSIRYTLEGDR